MNDYSWCKCSECGHKLFLYDRGNNGNNIQINIKCSSCKAICDVLVLNGKMEVKKHEAV